MKFEFDYNNINLLIIILLIIIIRPKICYIDIYVLCLFIICYRKVYITGAVFMYAFSILLCLYAAHVLAAVQNLDIYAFTIAL